MNPQHKTPCKECPWRRKALPGYLGPWSPQTWVRAAHGEDDVRCHLRTRWQCVGAAIYRANVCKRLRAPVLEMPVDRERVFASPAEFLAHHTRGEITEVSLAIFAPAPARAEMLVDPLLRSTRRPRLGNGPGAGASL